MEVLGIGEVKKREFSELWRVLDLDYDVRI